MELRAAGQGPTPAGAPPPWHINTPYPKFRYVQYTDGTFTTPVKQPEWLGVLGPILRGVVGETLVITFLNRTTRVLSMHPHGVRYDKDNEGALYNPSPGRGGWVYSREKFTYVWHVDREAGPAPGEPSSKVWLYHSHVMGDIEINQGLVGALVVTDRANARPDGSPKDVDREFVTLFMIFNENFGLTGDSDEGGYDPDGSLLRRREEFLKLPLAAQPAFLEGGLKHSVNGYIFGNLPGLEMQEGDRVRWYVLGLGSEQDLHTAHWHGKTVMEEGRRRTDVVELLPGSMKVADMNADNPGTWMLHCHVGDHMMGGMYVLYTIHPNAKRSARNRKKDERTQAIGSRIASFRLPRLSDGKQETLFGPSAPKATVAVFLSSRCPCSRGYDQRLNALAREYGPLGVRLLAVYANDGETTREIADHSRSAGFTFPALHDEGAVAARQLDARVTPEAFVMDAKRVLRYRGRIDDSDDLAKVRANDLRSALDALLAGREPPQPVTTAFGCSIPRPWDPSGKRDTAVRMETGITAGKGRQVPGRAETSAER